MPKYARGIPKDVQIRWCHPLYNNGCNSKIQNLTKCKLWPEKYCVEVNQLITSTNYNFLVAIKNDKTPAFGNETYTAGQTVERSKYSGMLF